MRLGTNRNCWWPEGGGAELIAAPGREEKFASLVTSPDRLCGFRRVGFAWQFLHDTKPSRRVHASSAETRTCGGLGPPGVVREPGEPLLVGRENRGPCAGGVLLRPRERAGFARGPSATALKAVIICVQTSWCRPLGQRSRARCLGRMELTVARWRLSRNDARSHLLPSPRGPGKLPARKLPARRFEHGARQVFPEGEGCGRDRGWAGNRRSDRAGVGRG